MTQQPKTIEEVREIVSRVEYEKAFRVLEAPPAEGRVPGFFVQIEYMEPDVITREPAVQRGRKWYVSPFATESEIVQTMLTAALASAEHQVREHFKYAPRPGDKPRAIYGPHFHANVLYSICGRRENYDARQDPA